MHSVSPIRVIAAVVSRGEQFLVCQRPPHKRHGGLWEFPGGKLEEGEDDITAAKRELREELGVAVLSVGQAEFEVYDAGSPFLIAFMPVEVAGEPQAHEHTAHYWGTTAELSKLPLAPSDRRYVEHLVARAAIER
jgi:8-oxo-dGTP diphosphatase